MPKRTNLFCFMDFEATGVDPDTDYPIQIAMIIADNNFSEVERFEAYLQYWPKALFDKDADRWFWKPQYEPAYQVHKIEPATLIEKGIPPHEIVRTLQHKITQHLGRVDEDRAIIVTDNGQYEYRMAQKLWRHYMGNVWPFHYSPWSVNFLYDWFLDGKPEKPHDAMKDTEIMFENVKFARKMTQNIKPLNPVDTTLQSTDVSLETARSVMNGDI